MNAGTTKALLTARFFNSACTVAEMANSSPKRPPIPEIVDRVLDLPSTRRGAYLDEVCAGDDSLRRHVEALIEGDTSSRIRLRRRDDLSELADSLNQLALRLEDDAKRPA